MATEIATTNSFPMQMLQSAIDKGAGLEQMQQLMDLQFKWEANEARKAFNEAFAKFAAEPITIKKRKLVSFKTRDGDTTSYRHAELSDVLAAAGPKLAEHGFSWHWGTEDADRSGIRVTCHLCHELGHERTVSMSATADTSGKKNAIQQIASTVSYLQRYTFLAVCGLTTEDMDNDGRGDPRGDELLEQMDKASNEKDLKAIKKELIAEWGRRIPRELMTHYNERFRALRNMPAARSDSVETGAVVDAEIVGEAKEPGVYVSESMERLLIEAGKTAGLEREHLLQRWPRIDTTNFNDVRAELKSMAEAD